jgi:predicted ATP-grasp superfamily ATP-dependent carboligase
VVRALPGEHEEVYLSLLKRCDAALVIGPETDGILSRLTERAEMGGIPLLGSSSSAAATAGNKAACSRLFDLADLPAPETRTATFSTAPRVAAQMGLPLVIKPIDGAGSDGVCPVSQLSDLPEILALVRRSTSHEQILLQSRAVGIPASVSLLMAEGRCLPMSLNLQIIESDSPFKYLGSQVPLDHPASRRAMELACSAAGLIPGLRGYVGIDMVLSDDLVQLIEINPRLTTSYIGLRRVARVNLAQAIWDACQRRILPDRIPLEGKVVIKMDDPRSWNLRLV